VIRGGGADRRQLARQLLDLRVVVLERGNALGEAEAHRVGAGPGEFHATHPQAHRTVVQRHTFETGDAGEAVEQRGRHRHGPAAGVQPGVEVAHIGGVKRRRIPLGRIGQDLEARRLAVEITQAQTGDALAAGRQQQRETLDHPPPLALAEVVEPDEAEGDETGRVAFRWRRDGCPARLAAPQQGPRIGRRQAVLQVRFGAQLRDIPTRILAREHLPHQLTEDVPHRAPPHALYRRALHIQQEELSFAPGEALHHQFHAPGDFLAQRGQAAHQIAGLGPGLQGEPGAVQFQGVMPRREGQQILARLQQGGRPAGAQKPLHGCL